MSAVFFFSFPKAITADGTYLSDPKNVEQDSNQFVLATVVASRTDGSYITTLQHSVDGGTTWADVDSTSAQAANGAVTKSVTANVISIIRLKIVASAVTTGATVTGKLFWGKAR